MASSLGVGIIGASADYGWARESHVPAVRKLEGLELMAVATNSQATADAAARAFGAKAAYGDGADLIRDPDVDLVAVCVNAPAHLPLVLGALEAGKHIYCEWPLGRSTPEAKEIAAAALAAGVHAAVGLQTRMNSAALRARDLIASGAIGCPLSARVYSSTAAFGNQTQAAGSYTERPENGVTLVTIQGAHTLDLAIAVLGGLADITAMTTIQYPEIQVGDNATPQARVTPDHVLVQARLAGGAALSVEVAGGRPLETPFRLEVVGEQGVLALDGGAPRGFQSGRLRLSLNGEAQHVDEGELASMPDTAVNVAGVYAALRNDITLGTSTAPDFHHAVCLGRLIDDVMMSARTGTRKSAVGWPTQK
jgi:predicted dehydrogenase